jgi:hypothetical protein
VIATRRAGLALAIALALAGCGGGAGKGGAGPAAPPPPSCEPARARAEQLYAAAAAAAPTPAAPTEVADNAAMVAADCQADPHRVAGCAAAATSIGQLEACLRPIDDDGSEGLGFRAE